MFKHTSALLLIHLKYISSSSRILGRVAEFRDLDRDTSGRGVLVWSEIEYLLLKKRLD